ncbi:MAG: tetratricopeptide repeat protein [Treponema sp.]
MKRFFVLAAAFLFFSCASNQVFVPGEKQAKIENIYAEYFNLAQEYEKLKNYGKAIDFYKMAMGDKSLHDAAYYKLGRCYAFNKQYDKAAEVFEKLLKKDNSNVALQSSLAYVTAMSGDTKRACLLYKNLVQENPDNSDLLVNYISVLIAHKDYETAKLNLDFLEKKFPDVTQIASLKENLESVSEPEPDKLQTLNCL